MIKKFVLFWGLIIVFSAPVFSQDPYARRLVARSILPVSCAPYQVLWDIVEAKLAVCSSTNNWEYVGGGDAGASQNLDNLSSTNINSSFLAQSGVDLGSTTKPFRNLFLYGSGTYGTTYFSLGGTPTGARVLTFPDNSTSFVEGKIATIPVNVDSAAAQDLYTVQTGKTLVVTKAILRSGSVELSLGDTSNFKIIDSASGANVTAQISMAAMSNTDNFAISTTSNAGRVITSGNKAQAKFDLAYGSPATATVDLFGYLF